MAPGVVGMSFAEKQLAKYGWKKGMGLGKNNDGISEPIKVKSCKNNRGIGNDPNKHLSHWWDMAYNRAVNNIVVDRAEDGNIELKRSDQCGITLEKPNMFNTNVLYDDFQQAGTLKHVPFTSKSQAGCDSDDESRGSSNNNNKGQGLLLDMTDAELLKLCGGGTAHKGARHGIRMGGKMKRLKAMEEADNALAAQRQGAVGSDVGRDDSIDAGKKTSSENNCENDVTLEASESEEVPKKKKKKSKKEKIEDVVQIDEDSAIELSSDEPNCKRIKKKKRKREEADNTLTDANEVSVESPIIPFEKEKKKKKKNRKHKEKEITENDIELEENETDCSTELPKKKKKSIKSERDTEEENFNDTKSKKKSKADETSDIEQNSDDMKPKKKKRKKQMSESC